MDTPISWSTEVISLRKKYPNIIEKIGIIFTVTEPSTAPTSSTRL